MILFLGPPSPLSHAYPHVLSTCELWGSGSCCLSLTFLVTVIIRNSPETSPQLLHPKGARIGGEGLGAVRTEQRAEVNGQEMKQ